MSFVPRTIFCALLVLSPLAYGGGENILQGFVSFMNRAPMPKEQATTLQQSSPKQSSPTAGREEVSPEAKKLLAKFEQLLTAPLPNHIGAQALFDSLNQNAALRDEFNILLAQSPKFQRMAAEGNAFLKKYREDFDQKYPPTHRETGLIENPWGFLSRSLHEYGATLRLYRDVPLTPIQAAEQARATVSAKNLLPPGLTDAEILDQVQLRGDAGGLYTFADMARTALRYELFNTIQRRVPPKPIPADRLQLWKDFTINEINRARIQNIGNAIEKAFELDPKRTLYVRAGFPLFAAKLRKKDLNTLSIEFNKPDGELKNQAAWIHSGFRLLNRLVDPFSKFRFLDRLPWWLSNSMRSTYRRFDENAKTGAFLKLEWGEPGRWKPWRIWRNASPVDMTPRNLFDALSQKGKTSYGIIHRDGDMKKDELASFIRAAKLRDQELMKAVELLAEKKPQEDGDKFAQRLYKATKEATQVKTESMTQRPILTSSIRLRKDPTLDLVSGLEWWGYRRHPNYWAARDERAYAVQAKREKKALKKAKSSDPVTVKVGQQVSTATGDEITPVKRSWIRQTWNKTNPFVRSAILWSLLMGGTGAGNQATQYLGDKITEWKEYRVPSYRGYEENGHLQGLLVGTPSSKLVEASLPGPTQPIKSLVEGKFRPGDPVAIPDSKDGTPISLVLKNPKNEVLQIPHKILQDPATGAYYLKVDRDDYKKPLHFWATYERSDGPFLKVEGPAIAQTVQKLRDAGFDSIADDLGELKDGKHLYEYTFNIEQQFAVEAQNEDYAPFKWSPDKKSNNPFLKYSDLKEANSKETQVTRERLNQFVADFVQEVNRAGNFNWHLSFEEKHDPLYSSWHETPYGRASQPVLVVRTEGRAPNLIYIGDDSRQPEIENYTPSEPSKLRKAWDGLWDQTSSAVKKQLNMKTDLHEAEGKQEGEDETEEEKKDEKDKDKDKKKDNRVVVWMVGPDDWRKKYPLIPIGPNADKHAERLKRLRELKAELLKDPYFKETPGRLKSNDLPSARILAFATAVEEYASGETPRVVLGDLAAVGIHLPKVKSHKGFTEALKKNLDGLLESAKKMQEKILKNQLQRSPFNEAYSLASGGSLIARVEDLAKFMQETDWKPVHRGLLCQDAAAGLVATDAPQEALSTSQK